MLHQQRIALSFCFLANAFILSSAAQDKQTHSVRSANAASLLEEVRQTLESSKDIDQEEYAWMSSELTKLYLANDQFDPATKWAEKASDPLKHRLFHSIFTARVDKLLAEAGDAKLTEDDQFAMQTELSTLAARCDGWTLLDDYKRLEKMADKLGVDASMEWIASVPVDVTDYEYRSGAIPKQLRKMEFMAKIGSQLVQANRFETLSECISQFGLEETQDQYKLKTLECFLNRKFDNIEAAEKLAASIEEPRARFWAAFRLGVHFGREGNLEKATHQTVEIDKIYDGVEPQTRQYYVSLLAWIVKLQLKAGAPTDATIERIKSLRKDHRCPKNIACIQALAGKVEDALVDEEMAFFAVKHLIDFEDDRSDFYRPFIDEPRERRIETALALASRLSNAHLRAHSMAFVASTIATTDLDRAEKILDEANEIARNSTIVAIFPEIDAAPIDQSWALAEIAQANARLGQPLKAVEAAALVSTADSPMKSMEGGKLPWRDFVLMRCSSFWHKVDRPFIENNGQEIFDLIRKLRELDSPNSHFNIDGLVGKFAELGMWSEAEQALELSREGFSQPLNPSQALGEAIAKDENVQRLEHWVTLYGDRYATDLVFSFCRYFPKQNLTPRLETLDALQSLLNSKLNETIVPFFVTGYWANGRKDEALRILESADLEQRGQITPKEIIRWALKNNEPELAMELIPKMKNPAYSITGHSWRSAILAADTEKLAQHEKWVGDQSNAIQIASKIGIVKRLLGVPFDQLSEEFPRRE